VDLGYTRTNVVICKNGKPRYNRSFNFGCSDFEIAIKNKITPEVPASYFDILRISAEDDYIPNKADTDMAETMNSLVLELTKIFDFFTSRELDNHIGSIVLTGGGSYYKNIDKHFFNEFNIPTTVLDDVDGLFIERNKVDFRSAIPIYANCIGAVVLPG